MRSEYMHWAKTHVGARYNIGASGVANYPLADLPLSLSDLEITGESYYGYAPLQEAISEHTGVSVERVFAALGTSQANYLAMAVLLRPGDEILVEDPSYELIISTARYLGAHIRRFSRDSGSDFAVDTDEVCRLITPRTRMVVVTNLHNPTSARVDDSALEVIARACERQGSYLLVDEVYLESVFEPAPRSAASLGDNIIATNSLTKVYGLSGLRCGWVLAPPDVVDAMFRLRDLFENIPPHVSERLSVVAFRHLGRIRERSKALIGENRRVLRETLLAREDIRCFDPGFGTVVFPKRTGGGVERVADTLLKEYETSITPGRFFGAPDRFRIGLGGENAMFREGMKRLCLVLDEMTGGGHRDGR